MKEIKKEIKSFKTMFVANDGTEFNSQEECEKYETSAKGVLSCKYAKLVIGSQTEETIFGMGSDGVIDIVQPKTEQDKDLIMQMWFLANGNNETEWSKRNRERGSNLIDTAIANGEPLLIYRGYDEDSFYIQCTPTSYAKDLLNEIATAIKIKKDSENKQEESK